MTNGTAARRDAGDIGRRIKQRRTELGLDPEALGARAGMDPTYITYLESQPARPAPATLVRLAVALETTATTLAGGGVDLPPGHGTEHGRRASLRVLTTDECYELLAPGGVGRFVFYDARGPVALPVNFAMVGRDVVFRTSPSTSARSGANHGRIGFEVDHIDDALQQGWSVLVSGFAREVHDADELRELEALDVTPWPEGEHSVFVRIEAAAVSGRRIEPASAGHATHRRQGAEGSA